MSEGSEQPSREGEAPANSLNPPNPLIRKKTSEPPKPLNPLNPQTPNPPSPGRP